MSLSPRGVRWATLAIVLLGSGCHFEGRPPSGSHLSESAVQEVVDRLYAALATRDSAGLAKVTFISASAMLDPTGTDVTLVPIRALLGVPERRSIGVPPRLARTDLRMDGNVATARVTLVAVSADGAGELEASDVVTLGRREAVWQVAHMQLGTWRTRSAP